MLTQGITKTLLRKGEYHDSVTLMRVAKWLSEQDAVLDSAVVMATPENLRLLTQVGLTTADLSSAVDTDLILAVKARSEQRAEELLKLAVQNLKTRAKPSGGRMGVRGLEKALEVLPEANLAIISIAGRYAGTEAMRALKRGLHVMLFSDNVPLETELQLKMFALSRGLLVMGPDCGTAIINGVPLAFANQVRRGSVGVVAAAGTGMQEVTTLLSKVGAGISQAIGTGGRDVKKEIGGLMFLEGIRLLLADPETEVLLLVSKPPHESVLERIEELVAGASKPVVATFLGAEKPIKGVLSTHTLEEGALKAACLARGQRPQDVDRQLVDQESNELDLALTEKKRLSAGQKYLRGLYTGGTFVAEAQVILSGKVQDLFSNAPAARGQQILDPLRSQGHTIIDFGEDEFTVGRPHPMIDFSLRNKRILEESQDPAVAVLLLDLVLGWGAHPHPLPELLPTLKQAKHHAEKAGRHLPVVMSVTGTDSDPQHYNKVVSELRAAGMIVAASNAAAVRIATEIVGG